MASSNALTKSLQCIRLSWVRFKSSQHMPHVVRQSHVLGVRDTRFSSQGGVPPSRWNKDDITWRLLGPQHLRRFDASTWLAARRSP
eukprot:CAMPEP_0119366602 /NCGR_PEP_ID=MMETSP1334-20130426/13451_1 /TAXON_ID=127549 /ORGANISM="Calcidiscus leptoporus, Strain RCC1130" /LENGTH=85 /DNA_ID=CAMNT_0007382841 /DNA_START=214 /DNA_END=468 /DNA_ORIENTATION=+